MKDFNIPFVGLKLGSHLFKYQIDNTFFEAFNFNEYFNTRVTANATLVKKTTFIEISVQISGTVNLSCDITNIPYDQEITGNLDLVVKFGSEYNDNDIDILILSHGAYQLNIAQYIYELIILSVPAKRVHPKVTDGTMQSKTLDILNSSQKTVPAENAETDPRWDMLKNLITEKNT